MIRVAVRPEPATFPGLVRTPGQRYLAKTPRPTSEQFASHDYWTRVLTELHDAYGGVCSFMCQWIPHVTGSATVEHFLPKVKHPHRAYEWDNYRLMCGTLNGRKGEHEDVLDPFRVEDGWFTLRFPSLFVFPHADLEPARAKQVEDTIKRLRLNDEGTCVKARAGYVRDYCRGDISFAHMEKEAPFIAKELSRQRLVDEIRMIMGY